MCLAKTSKGRFNGKMKICCITIHSYTTMTACFYCGFPLEDDWCSMCWDFNKAMKLAKYCECEFQLEVVGVDVVEPVWFFHVFFVKVAGGHKKRHTRKRHNPNQLRHHRHTHQFKHLDDQADLFQLSKHQCGH